MQPESIHLSFRQGSADKVYNAELKQTDDGWLVNFSYGRRGKPLRSGTKTAKPIPYERAKKAYDKLVTSKTAKGYTPDSSGTPFTAPQVDQERTGWLPQLLNPIEEENLLETFRRLHNHVAVQTKHDGERRGIFYQNGELYGSNRRGLKVALHPTIEKAFQRLIEFHSLGDFILDSEDMGESVVIFDILEWDGRDVTDRPFMLRTDILSKLPLICEEADIKDVIDADAPLYCDSMTSLIYFLRSNENNQEEGIVIRDPNAPYTPGRPNSGGPCIKLKFYASATCRVASVHPTKRSIGLELADEQGMFDFVGNCTIPANYKIPSVGDLVEVKYLYAYRNGSIYQPQYKGIRTDLDSSAAVTRQLKYKE
jgi:bifunctional non-homologous end joining protein LigD